MGSPCATAFVLPLGILLVLVATPTPLAHAQNCGEVVIGSVTLTSDLTCLAGHGLVVGEGATLDCAGHSITGGDQVGQYGIYVRNVGGAVVRNCIVSHFEVGIRLRGATNATVEDSRTERNTRYGVEITLGSTGALLQRNDIGNNSDEGIHVSGPPARDAGHRIIGNRLSSNVVEGVYLVDSDANTISDNAIAGHGTAGIYLTASNRNTIDGNTLTGDPIQLVNGSTGNILTRNTIIGQRLKLDGASSNSVEFMSVQGQGGSPSSAYEFNNASNNTIADSEAVSPGDHHIRAANGSRNNTFTRFLADPGPLKCFVDRRSSVSVTDPDGAVQRCGPRR